MRRKDNVASRLDDHPARVPHARASCVRSALLAAVALLGPAVSPAHAVNLIPLLTAPGTTVTLNGTSVYTIAEFSVTSGKTILCNGARITSTGGPIRANGAGVQLIIDHCRIDGTGWALLGALDGASLTIRNGTELTGNGANSAVYVKGATLDVDGGTISNGHWGVSMENADAAIHGVVFRSTMWAVQNVAGSVTLDGGCQLTNTDPVNSGAGVSVIPSTTYPSRAASAVIHDSTFVGFGNAVDIQPTASQGLPPSTVEIVDCTFDGAVYSALAAVDSPNVHIARTRVTNAQTDGIYFVNSTGLIEDTQVLDSLNSGITFWGCPDGFTLRNSLVRNSVHQGVAVVADPRSGDASHGVRILDSTLTGNVIANLYVDDRSDAIVHGTIMSGAPDMSVRLHGSPTTTLLGAFVFGSHGGLEMKDGADARVGLSVLSRHQRYAAFAYQNASATLSHCAVQENGLDPGTADNALVVDTGARMDVDHSVLAAAGEKALYNNAGTASTATSNFWDDASGPALQAGGGGAGSILGWTKPNGSSVAYEPFLAAAPLDVAIDEAFALAPDGTTAWTAPVGVTLSLDGASGITPVPAGLAAILRLRDTGALALPAPPVGTSPDGVLAVWIEYDLLSRASGGSLHISTIGEGGTVSLARLDADGQWAPVAATFNVGTGEIIYAPSDPRALQGIFAFGDGKGCATARTCLQPLVGAPLCAEPLPPKTDKGIAKKLRVVLTKLTKAVAATKPQKAARFVQQARKALVAIETLAGKATVAKHGPISTACRDAIVAAIAPGRQRLEAGSL
jgi:hypothetical protein